MSKVRRNDPCPCGSGKKYKRCCGANNASSFNPTLRNKEFEDLNTSLIQYAFSDFGIKLTRRTERYLNTFLPDMKDQDETNTYMTIMTAWVVLFESIDKDQTIFDAYFANHQRHINHPRTKEVFSSWPQAIPSVFKVVEVEENPVHTVKIMDMVTNQTYNYHVRNETTDDLGDFMIGTLIPYVNTYDFLFGAIKITKDREGLIVNLIEKLKEKNEQMKDAFPRILAEVIQSTEEKTLEWLADTHELVAELFAERMKAKDFSDDVISSGVSFWNLFCKHTNPTIKKHEGYAAALEYMIHLTFSDEQPITQSALAKEYGTSAGTISTNYRKLKDHLEYEKKLHQDISTQAEAL